MLKQKWMSFAKRPALETVVFEIGPFLIIGAFILIKLMLISVLLPAAIWGEERSLAELTASFLNIITEKPQIILATASILILLFALLMLIFNHHRRFQILILVNLVLTTIGLADLVHVRFFDDVLSISRFDQNIPLRTLVPNIVKNLFITDALFYVDIIIALLIYPFYRSFGSPRPFQFRQRLRISAAMIVIGLLLIVPTFRQVRNDTREFYSYSSLHIEVASAMGILPYHVGDMIISLTANGPVIGDKERRQVQNFLTAYKKSRNPDLSTLRGIARGKNVIIISAESLHAFPIGLVVEGQAVTPRLTAFAGESLQYVNFFDQTHLGTTSDAEFLALQSLFPLPTGALATKFHKNSFRGLPKILAENGYTTVSMCGAKGYFWHMDEIHPRLGFQKSYFKDDYQASELISGWIPDREFFDQSAAKLAELEEPFMAYLLTSSNHHPFRLPDKYRKLKLGRLEGTIVGDYLHSVHYLDAQFGLFFDRLRAAGQLEKSLIVIYGDHHGFLGKSPELAGLLGLSKDEEILYSVHQKRIPLLIRVPRREASGIRKTTGGQIDISPTVLGLLGIEDERSVMLGADLNAKPDNMVVFRDGSFIKRTNYFIHRAGTVSDNRCYRLTTGREIDCTALRPWYEAARERLKISDLIIHGDLIPLYTGPAGSRAMR